MDPESWVGIVIVSGVTVYLVFNFLQVKQGRTPNVSRQLLVAASIAIIPAMAWYIGAFRVYTLIPFACVVSYRVWGAALLALRENGEAEIAKENREKILRDIIAEHERSVGVLPDVPPIS